MATRRNVPSKDVFRVIKCGLDRTPKDSSNPFRKALPLHQGCFRDTNPYSSTEHLPQIRPRYSTLHRQAAFPSLYSTTTARQTFPRYRSSVRSISTSKKSTTTSPAEPYQANVPLDFEDIESTQSEYSFFPSASTTDSRVSVPKSSEEQDGTESQRWINEETVDEALEDDIPILDIGPKSEDAVFTVPPYIAPDQPVPIYIPSTIGHYIRTIEDYGDRRHNYLYNHILLTRNENGQGAAIRAAEEILECYVSTRLDQDWSLAKRLYISLCHRFMSVHLQPIRNSLVRSMLEESPPRLEAVSLLAEGIKSDVKATDRQIHSYLESFCEEQPDWDLRLAEAEKILQSAREYPQLQTTRILLPLVRYAVAENYPDLAHDLAVRCSQDYCLAIDFSVFSEIIKGYARQGNMSAIDELLGHLHHRGFSRTKPYEFAALVRTVFQFLIPVRDPGRMFDFLTYSLQNHGLVPTTNLSVSVTKHFVELRRFDLLQRWADTKRTLFPNILHPGTAPLAAYEIDETWTHMSASPSVVLFTCKALAHDTLRDPFGEEFRYMTNNWLLKSLRKTSELFMLHNNIDKQLVGFKRFLNLESMFEFSTRLIEFASRGNSNTRISLFVDAFRRKVEAAQETEFLVNRFHEYVQQYGPILKFEAQSIPLPPDMKKPASTSLSPRGIQRMVGQKLARMMVETYGNTRSSGDKDQRHVVIDMIRYLQRAQRHLDCAILVREFWNTGLVTGRFYTHEIIKNWIRMSYEMRHQKILLEALWAAIDSEPEHIIGDRLLILIRTAMSVIMEEVKIGRISQYPNQLEELEYLVSRCYRRKWQHDGCPEMCDIADPYLKKWKKEQEESTSSHRIRNHYTL